LFSIVCAWAPRSDEVSGLLLPQPGSTMALMSSTKQIATKPALGLILLFTTDHNFFVSILEPSSTRKTPVQNKGISEHRIFAGGNSMVGSLEREGPQPSFRKQSIRDALQIQFLLRKVFSPNVKNPVPGRSERGQSVIFLHGAGRTQLKFSLYQNRFCLNLFAAPVLTRRSGSTSPRPGPGKAPQCRRNGWKGPAPDFQCKRMKRDPKIPQINAPKVAKTQIPAKSL